MSVCHTLFREHELQLRASVGHAVERGKVDLTVSVESNAGTADTPSARLNVYSTSNATSSKSKEAAETLGIGEPAVTGTPCCCVSPTP